MAFQDAHNLAISSSSSTSTRPGFITRRILNLSTIALSTTAAVLAFSIQSSAQTSESSSSFQRTKGLTETGLLKSLSSRLQDAVKDVPTTDTTISVLPPEEFNEPEKKFYLRFKAPRKEVDQNHLVFFVPGFGAENKIGQATVMLELLGRRGFFPVAFDSPASFRFLKNSSTFSIPGIQKLDAQDLYIGMQEARKTFEKKYRQGNKFTKVSLVGASLGGLNVSMISLLSKNGPLKFQKVMAINPPISNIYGLSLIDQMVLAYYDSPNVLPEFKLNNSTLSSSIHLLNAFIELATGKTRYDDLKNYVSNFLDRKPFDLERSQWIVGYGFSGTVADSVKAYLETRAGEMPARLTAEFQSLIPFYDVFNQISLPEWRGLYDYRNVAPDRYPIPAPRPNADISNLKIPNAVISLRPELARLQSSQPLPIERMDDLMLESDSVRGNATRLQKMPEYVIITYEDDFLLQADDSKWLQDTFPGSKDRPAKAFIFPDGGHLGGFYQPDFQDLVVRNLLADRN